MRKNDLLLKYDPDVRETLPEETAQKYALDMAEINGHQVYFVVFDNKYFGYSALVYRDGKILPYALDHAGHHKDMFRKNLRAEYIRSLSAKLFTDEQLAAPLKDYADYRARMDYLHNHFGYQRDHVSIFYHKACVAGSPEQKAEDERILRESAGKMYDPIAFGWYDDQIFVARHIALHKAVQQRFNDKAKEGDYDFFYDAFKYEMYNHEYPIDYYQGNWDVLSEFGNIEYDRAGDDSNLDFYFDQLNFAPMQRNAYLNARSYVMSHFNC